MGNSEELNILTMAFLTICAADEKYCISSHFFLSCPLKHVGTGKGGAPSGRTEGSLIKKKECNRH